MKHLKLLYPFLLMLLIGLAMMSKEQIGFFAMLTVLCILFELYTLSGFISMMHESQYKTILTIVYVILSILCIFGFVYASQNMRQDDTLRSSWSNLLLGFSFALIIAKFVFTGLLVIQDVGRLITGGFLGIKDLFMTDAPTRDSFIPSRRKAITLISSVVAAVPFAAMLYGITKGKYQFTVKKETLNFKDLPKAFDGFKIVQISDIHSGSWDSVQEVERGLQIIQDQKPDIIVFTGDLVNTYKDEIDPFIDGFSKLSAPFGKYASLGNHDYYGSYRVEGKEEKKAYWDDFFSKFKKMGFDLVNNSNRYIEKDGEKISLVGVENWGAGRWFPKEGDLDKALEGTAADDFTVLMSHDPTHWEQKVLKHAKHVHLTMSGHTHGMQFGINLPGFQWSPVKYRYKRWGGLYHEQNQYLYVNRGFGFLAFPGRVGMWPEITVFELKSADV